MRTNPTKKRDHGTGGFRNKSGSEYFVFRPVPGANQKWVNIGKSGELTRKDKEAKAREILTAYVVPEDGETVTYRQVGVQLVNYLRDVKIGPRRPSKARVLDALPLHRLARPR